MLPGRPSDHFTWAELGDPPASLAGPTRHLAWHLERLRRICDGKPLTLLSAYRSPQRNAAVGGALRSQHLEGRAADLPVGYATVDQAQRAGFTGIGSAGRWAVHVDVRAGPPTRWEYSWSSSTAR